MRKGPRTRSRSYLNRELGVSFVDRVSAVQAFQSRSTPNLGKEFLRSRRNTLLGSFPCLEGDHLHLMTDQQIGLTVTVNPVNGERRPLCPRAGACAARAR